jgi:hypothetical protein
LENHPEEMVGIVSTQAN